MFTNISSTTAHHVIALQTDSGELQATSIRMALNAFMESDKNTIRPKLGEYVKACVAWSLSKSQRRRLDLSYSLDQLESSLVKAARTACEGIPKMQLQKMNRASTLLTAGLLFLEKGVHALCDEKRFNPDAYFEFLHAHTGIDQGDLKKMVDPADLELIDCDFEKIYVGHTVDPDTSLALHVENPDVSPNIPQPTSSEIEIINIRFGQYFDTEIEVHSAPDTKQPRATSSLAEPIGVRENAQHASLLAIDPVSVLKETHFMSIPQSTLGVNMIAPNIPLDALLPLHQAVTSQNSHNIRDLANKKTLAQTDINGRHALHFAAAMNREVSPDAIRILRTVISSKISLDCTDDLFAKDALGNTPLHYAAEADNKEVVDLLKATPKDLNECNNNGDTVLHVAVRFGNLEMVKKLVAKGSNLSLQNEFGETALTLARGNPEILKLSKPSSLKRSTQQQL